MNLVKENLDAEKEKNKKMARVVLVLILLTILILSCIGAYMLYLKSKELVVYLDNVQNDAIEAGLLFKEDGSVYLPVRYLAEILGYKTFSGESQNKSEDKNKCYIESPNQIVDFVVNSNKIQKTNLIVTENKYTYDDLKHHIEYINNELYINTEDLEIAMNATYSYNAAANKIEIYTLDNLVATYANTALSYGYTGISENIANNVSIFDNILIVNSEEKVGAMSLETGKEILETKYDDVLYLKETGEFLVTSDLKKGIINQDKKKVIELKYEDISVLSEEKSIYIVKENGKYGLVNVKGTQILYPKYDQIGIDITNFEDNEIKNKYLIGNDFIPVKYGEKWGFVNTSGNEITKFNYDALGYTGSTKNDDILNLLVIPTYNVVVVRKDSKEENESQQKYILLGPDGSELYKGTGFDDVYMKKEEDVAEYFIVMGEKSYKAEDQLQKLGLKSVIDDGDGDKINVDINQNNEEKDEEKNEESKKE